MLFDAATLARFRKTQESTMMHECDIESYIVGDDGTISYGAPIHSDCGFKVLNLRYKADTALYEVVQADAELRLPLSVPVGMHDRVTLTKSFEKELNPVRHFEITGFPDSFGPSANVVQLKEVYI